MSLSDAYETTVLNFLFTDVAVTRPTEWYLGLSSTDPGDDGSGVTPPADPAYARIAATFTVTGDAAANDTVLEFPEATVNQGELTYGVVYDAPTAGNVIASGLLRDNEGTPTPVTIASGQILRIPSGAFVVTAD